MCHASSRRELSSRGRYESVLSHGVAFRLAVVPDNFPTGVRAWTRVSEVGEFGERVIALQGQGEMQGQECDKQESSR